MLRALSLAAEQGAVTPGAFEVRATEMLVFDGHALGAMMQRLHVDLVDLSRPARLRELMG